MNRYTEKEEQVLAILLSPIICSEDNNIKLNKEGIICTGQKYKCEFDHDMSDFTIGFYEIIYKKILKNTTILDENGKINNKEFAGDTMNSFNSIANVTLGAGNTKKQRTEYCEWPPLLRKYHSHYHCLANFWIIPMKLGRGLTKKFNYFDSLDVFLGILQEHYNCKMSGFDNYFKCINDFESFCETHYINTFHNKDKILDLYKNKEIKEGEKLVEYAMDSIEQRADRIAKSECSNELWDYFNNFNLFDDASIITL